MVGEVLIVAEITIIGFPLIAEPANSGLAKRCSS
jgi:hypothetical protein